MLKFLYLQILTSVVVEGLACNEPCLYYANATSLKRIPLQASTGREQAGSPTQTIYSGGKIIGPIALDHSQKRIFWSDVVARKIYSINTDGTGLKEVIKWGIGLCEGIAYDWSTDNIYWTDYLHDWIEVANSDGKNRRSLINGSIDQPRAIAVNPIAGYVFWSDIGARARIERASLDGRNRRAIVSSNLVWPIDLAVDFAAGRLYWIDAFRDKIESVEFSGGSRRQHADISYYGQIRMLPYSIALFAQSSLAYFTDLYRSMVLRQSLATSTSPNAVTRGPILSRRIGQVRILHSSNQPTSSSQCKIDNGQCSHLCVKRNTSAFSCLCPIGTIKSEQNSKLCQVAELDYHAFLLDGDGNSSKIFHLSKYVGQPQFKFETLNISTSQRPVGVDFDPKEQVIYWSDVIQDKILKMKIDGSGYQVIFERRPSTFEGVAIDIISKLLYFADYLKETIEVVKLDGSARKVLIKDDLVNPRDIQLYHEKGLLFFSDWRRIDNQPKIESAFLDGTNRRKIITVSVSAPAGLAIDKVEGRLYWCDMRLDRIESSDFDGKNRRVLFDHYGYSPFVPIDTITGEVQTPFGLAVFRDQLFWTDWSSKAVYYADKRTGGKINMISTGFKKPMQIHVYSKQDKTEFKKLYLFSHAKSSTTDKYTCFQQSCTLDVTKEPALCPPGYKQTRLGQKCTKCSTRFGLYARRCPCNDWMTCAHRSYLEYFCPTLKPFINFKVRECVKAVHPGFCPSFKCDAATQYNDTCVSDHDCYVAQKCCNTSCGRKCLNSTTELEKHPCQYENGGCSHFCFRMPNGFKCGCPDSMILHVPGMKSCIHQTGYCAKNYPCLNNGVCQDRGINSFNCSCPLNLRGQRCELCDYCQNEGTCVVNGTSIKCQCKPGYEGNQCQNSRINCTSICQNGGTCSIVNGTANCQCPSGFTGNFCETPMQCYPNPCGNNATCTVVNGQYKCTCQVGFTGQKCETANVCLSNPCMNDGTCRVHNGQPYCSCSAHFTGPLCETPVQCYPNPCLHNATCEVRNGMRKCNCAPNFTGSNCATRIECSPNPCQHGGNCFINGTETACNCKPQFFGKRCETQIACLENTCLNNATCTIVNGQYRCTCQVGFTGQKCETANVCVSNPCMNDGTCRVHDGQLYCSCSAYFTGQRCETPMQCYPNPCRNSGTCSGSRYSHSCKCSPGFYGDNCENIDACISSPCFNRGTCNRNRNSYTCRCIPGFTGQRCETSLVCFSGLCQNSGTCITLNATSYSCNCINGYIGKHCSKKDFCAANQCSSKSRCVNGDSNYICQCDAGYTGKHCETSTDPCTGNLCRNGATCVKLESAYKCRCRADFTGQYCENKIDDCIGNTCQNSGRCVDGINSYSCVCKQYFSGLRCENLTNSCQKDHCNNQGTCVAQKPDAYNMLPLICKCIKDYAGRHCQVFYGNNTLQVSFTVIPSRTLSKSRIMETLAAAYNSYCDKSDCVTEKSKNRRRRGGFLQLVVNKDDVIIPDGYPKPSTGGQNVLKYSILGWSGGVQFIVSNDAIKNGFVVSKSLLESQWNVLSLKIGSAPPPNAGKSSTGGTTDSKKLAAGLVTGIVILTIVVLLAVYYITRRRKKKEEQFKGLSFDNVLYQSSAELHNSAAATTTTSPAVELRRSSPKKINFAQFQFSNLTNEDNHNDNEKDNDYSLHESKGGMRGIVNPFCDLPEEERKVRHVIRTDSTTVVMGESKLAGLTGLDIDDSSDMGSRASLRKSPRADGNQTMNDSILLQVQPSEDLTAFANPCADTEIFDDSFDFSHSRAKTHVTLDNPINPPGKTHAQNLDQVQRSPIRVNEVNLRDIEADKVDSSA